MNNESKNKMLIELKKVIDNIGTIDKSLGIDIKILLNIYSMISLIDDSKIFKKYYIELLIIITSILDNLTNFTTYLEKKNLELGENIDKIKINNDLKILENKMNNFNF